MLFIHVAGSLTTTTGKMDSGWGRQAPSPNWGAQWCPRQLWGLCLPHGACQSVWRPTLSKRQLRCMRFRSVFVPVLNIPAGAQR